MIGAGVEGIQSHAGIPAVPFDAEGGTLRGFGVHADDDVVAEGQRRVQGALGELAEAAHGHDHQTLGGQRSVREPAQVEFESYHLVVALDPFHYPDRGPCQIRFH